jgi:hypothetical protein
MVFDDKYDETLIKYAKKYNIPINKSLDVLKLDVLAYEKRHKIRNRFTQHMMFILNCDLIACHYETPSC